MRQRYCKIGGVLFLLWLLSRGKKGTTSVVNEVVKSEMDLSEHIAMSEAPAVVLEQPELKISDDAYIEVAPVVESKSGVSTTKTDNVNSVVDRGNVKSSVKDYVEDLKIRDTGLYSPGFTSGKGILVGNKISDNEAIINKIDELGDKLVEMSEKKNSDKTDKVDEPHNNNAGNGEESNVESNEENKDELPPTGIKDVGIVVPPDKILEPDDGADMELIERGELTRRLNAELDEAEQYLSKHSLLDWERPHRFDYNEFADSSILLDKVRTTISRLSKEDKEDYVREAFYQFYIEDLDYQRGMMEIENREAPDIYIWFIGILNKVLLDRKEVIKMARGTDSNEFKSVCIDYIRYCNQLIYNAVSDLRSELHMVEGLGGKIYNFVGKSDYMEVRAYNFDEKTFNVKR